MHRVSRWLPVYAFLIPLLVLGHGNIAPAAEELIFAFDWIPIAKHSGFYAAVDRGHFREQGLSVTVQRGFGSGDTIKRVAARSADFGFADAGSLILARSKGSETQLVGMFHAKNLMGVIFLKGSGIQKPKDLEGRSIGDTVAGASRIIFPAFAAANGIDLPKVQWMTMEAGVKVPSLVTRRVDSLATFSLDFPTIRAAAKKAGVEVDYFLYADYGVDIYSNGVIARDESVRAKPDLVRRFVHGTYGGIAWAVEHPAEAVKTFLKFNPTADPDLTRAEWEIAVDHLLTKEALENGIGYIDREKMKFTRDILTRYMKLDREVGSQEIYTNEFLPKLFPKRP